MANNFDGILSQIGTGKWNMFYYVLLGYWFSCVAYQTLGSAFLAPNVGYTCIVPDSAITTAVTILDAQVFGQATNNSTTYDSSEDGQSSKEPSLCTYKVENTTTGKIYEEKCSKWDYNDTTFVSTATSEFDLVCDWKFYRATYQSIYMLGIFVGAGVNGYMSDRFGRRKMLIIGSCLYSIIGTILTWLPSMPTILTARFLLGTMHPTSLITGYVLAMEITEPRRRGIVGMVIFIAWSFGTMLLSAWAYFIRDWRWLQLAISLPCFLFLPSLWFMDESPRWLVTVGRHDEAIKILQKAARWNNVEIPPKERMLTLMKAVCKESENQAKGDEDSFKMKVKQWLKEATILFRTPRLRLITLTMYVDFFVVAMVYFGLSLGAGSFKVSPFMYIAISGLVEVPSHTVTIPIVLRYGCKGPLIVSFFITGATMLVQPLIPQDYNWMAITAAMIGKMTISTVFQILGLFATELFPTEVRNRGLGTSMMSSRVGAMISPYLLGFTGVTYPWATPVIFGLASIVAGLASLPLRETKNTALPDTIVHLEGYSNPAMEDDSAL